MIKDHIPAVENRLPIMEQFYTIQGEGYHTGKSAVFIRLGGCDVGCHWCDVKESWNKLDHPSISIDDIVETSVQFTSRFAVITGGEPVMYNLELLCKKLKEHSFYIALETSGAYEITGEWHWICLSPKKRIPPKPSYYKLANELKVIIFNKSDFIWAEEHAREVNKNCKLYLQVEWSKREELTPLIIDYVKKNPKWNISVQTHKYLNIP